jgi:hypothetical protein
VIGKVGFAEHEESGDGAHQVVVHPQAAHGVVDGRIDHHGGLVRVVCRDFFVHLEQVAVFLFNHVLAVAIDGIGKIEIDGLAGLAHATAHVALLLGVA